jgi:DNA-binding MarR family transcriptional regulator
VSNLTQTTNETPPESTARWTPLPVLLDDVSQDLFAEFRRRLVEAGHSVIRPGHGCVFRFVDEGGSRLTDLAETAGLTKQAVGEVVADLERLGYVERAADPADGRAKVIRLTDLGADAQRTGLAIFRELERELGKRYGAERVAVLRELLEEIAADARLASTTA